MGHAPVPSTKRAREMAFWGQSAKWAQKEGFWVQRASPSLNGLKEGFWVSHASKMGSERGIWGQPCGASVKRAQKWTFWGQRATKRAQKTSFWVRCFGSCPSTEWAQKAAFWGRCKKNNKEKGPRKQHLGSGSHPRRTPS